MTLVGVHSTTVHRTRGQGNPTKTPTSTRVPRGFRVQRLNTGEGSTTSDLGRHVGAPSEESTVQVYSEVRRSETHHGPRGRTPNEGSREGPRSGQGAGGRGRTGGSLVTKRRRR